VLGICPVDRVDDRVGHVWPERSSRRVLRDRNMFSDMGAMIVVSHASRFSTSVVSLRLTRSHVSWTASSASLNEPSIR
jgi:hypothetical protein